MLFGWGRTDLEPDDWQRLYPLVRGDLARIGPILLAFAIGAAGAAAFYVLKLPLPFFLGSLTACLVASVLKAPIAPPRALSIPIRCVIGAGIGAAFTPALIGQLGGMLGSFAIFVPYTFAIILGGRLFFEKVAGLDKPTAFFAAVPGGLTDMVSMGAEAGANQRAVVLIQATRILLIVFTVPLWLQWIDGIAVGGRVVQTLPLSEMRAIDGLALVVIGWVGWKAAVRLKLAGAPLVGPMILSALAHALGLTTARVPFEVLTFCQVVLGAILGCRFRGLTWSEFSTTVLWGVAFAAIVVLATGFGSLAIEQVTGINHVSVLLAYAPGGQTELNLLAYILGADIAFVALHHLIRLAIVFASAQMVFARNTSWRSEGGGL